MTMKALWMAIGFIGIWIALNLIHTLVWEILL